MGDIFKNVSINRRKKLIVNNGTVYLFILLCLFALSLTIPIPGTGKHIVIYAAEIPILIGVMIRIASNGFRVCWKPEYDNKRVINTIKATLLFVCYIIITRLFFFIKEFNVELLTYPRISIVFLICYFWIINTHYSSKEKIDSILIFIVVVNVFQSYQLIATGTVRYSEVLMNINIYVCIIIIALPTIMHLFINSGSIMRRALYAFILFSSAIIVFASGSRGGTGMFALIVIYFLFRERDYKSIAIIILASAGMILYILHIENPYFSETLNRSLSVFRQFGKAIDESALISDNLRYEIWNKGWTHILSSPLFGSGYLAFKFVMVETEVYQSAHNVFIEMLMSYGIIGTIVYLYIIYNICKSCETRDSNNSIKAITIVGYFVFSFFQPTFCEKNILFLFLMIITSTYPDIGKKEKYNPLQSDCLKSDFFTFSPYACCVNNPETAGFESGPPQKEKNHPMK